MMRLGLGLGLTQAVAVGESAPAWLEELRSPGGDLPTDALSFASANYLADEQESSLAELISFNADFPNDPPNIEPGDGLHKSFNTIVGATRDAILAALVDSPVTVVMDFTFYSANPVKMEIYDNPGYNTDIFIFFNSGGNGSVNTPGGATQINQLSVAHHRAAFVITPSRMAISIDGGNVIEGDAFSPPTEPAPDTIGISAGDNGDGATIHFIAVYDGEASDNDLEDMSAL